MNSKRQPPSIRPAGQKSIPSTFFFRPSTPLIDCSKQNEEIKAPSEKGSRLSLSEFLDRRLRKSPVLPGTVLGKRKPFQSPVVAGGGSDTISGELSSEIGKINVPSALGCVFEQFKHTEKLKEDVVCQVSASSIQGEMQASRKRRTYAEAGSFDNQSARKCLVVLGDDSKAKQINNRRNCVRHEKRKEYFNHYGSGGGWWDSNMEGIDEEEVGAKEVWEGMGSTTLGGLEWH